MQKKRKILGKTRWILKNIQNLIFFEKHHIFDLSPNFWNYWNAIHQNLELWKQFKCWKIRIFSKNWKFSFGFWIFAQKYKFKSNSNYKFPCSTNLHLFPQNLQFWHFSSFFKVWTFRCFFQKLIFSQNFKLVEFRSFSTKNFQN